MPPPSVDCSRGLDYVLRDVMIKDKAHSGKNFLFECAIKLSLGITLRGQLP